MGNIGLGKDRSAFGNWSDKMNLSQQKLVEITGINKNTISMLCNENYNPFNETKLKVISALRKKGYTVSARDFW